MAEPLKNLLSLDAARHLAGLLHAAWPAFSVQSFLKQVQPGYEDLALMERGQRLADALAVALPADFASASACLVDAMGPPMPLDAAGEPMSDGQPFSAFVYLPMSLYIGQHGLAAADFEHALRAQHALTQRFTAEFCIRPFLVHHTQATLARLHDWAHDPNAHVRRLVSEGTRPRLPWASRLPAFQRDPSPVLPLLEKLRDDPSSYVRRSVANHLGDIGKDHPDLLVDLAQRWRQPSRERMLRHALRLLIKQGHAGALGVLGMNHVSGLVIDGAGVEPDQARIGGAVTLSAELFNPTRQTQTALVDLRVFYVKADGSARPKVFKLKEVSVEPGVRVLLAKRLSLAQMSTRVHYPGTHRAELLLNGRPHPLGSFELTPA